MLSGWKTIEIFKIVRFQSLNLSVSQRDSCCKQQNCWISLSYLTEERKKATKPKEEVILKLEEGKVC